VQKSCDTKGPTRFDFFAGSDIMGRAYGGSFGSQLGLGLILPLFFTREIEKEKNVRIRILCPVGDANCVLEENDARAIFDKLTGRTSEPLLEELRTKVPDTFQALQALWGPGKLSYFPVDFSTQEMVTKFDPQVQDLVFVAPIRGG